MAGVTVEDLEDPDKRKFIYEFISGSAELGPVSLMPQETLAAIAQGKSPRPLPRRKIKSQMIHPPKDEEQIKRRSWRNESAQLAKELAEISAQEKTKPKPPLPAPRSKPKEEEASHVEQEIEEEKKAAEVEPKKKEDVEEEKEKEDVRSPPRLHFPPPPQVEVRRNSEAEVEAETEVKSYRAWRSHSLNLPVTSLGLITLDGSPRARHRLLAEGRSEESLEEPPSPTPPNDDKVEHEDAEELSQQALTVKKQARWSLFKLISTKQKTEGKVQTDSSKSKTRVTRHEVNFKEESTSEEVVESTGVEITTDKPAGGEDVPPWESGPVRTPSGILRSGSRGRLRLSKEDITPPQDFQHVLHLGPLQPSLQALLDQENVEDDNEKLRVFNYIISSVSSGTTETMPPLLEETGSAVSGTPT